MVTGRGLTRKVIRGGVWNTAGSLGDRLLGLVRTVILARLLLPADFGLLGISLATIGSLQSITHLGIGPALIQRREVDAPVLNTVWVLSILRGLLLCLILVLSAPYAASFFKEPRVIPIIRFLALNQFLIGLQSIGVFLLEKELDFKRRSLFNLLAGVFTTMVSVIAAFILGNVWALVWGELAGGAIRLVLSYHFHPFRPRFDLNFRIARELFSYGRHIFVFQIILYLLLQGDDLIVGRFLGPVALGYYTLAYQLACLPATMISGSISGVTFPAYAKLQDSVDDLRTAYLRTIRLVGFLTIPAAGFLFIFATEIISVVFGPRWLPMVPVMRALCFFGVFRSLNTTFGALFQGIGKPDLLKKITFWQLVWFAAIVYPCLTHLGFVGIAVAITSASLFAALLASRGLKRWVQVGLTTVLGSLAGPLISGLLVGAGGYAAARLFNLASVFPLVAVFLGYCVLYLVSIRIINRGLFQEVQSLVRQVFV